MVKLKNIAVIPARGGSKRIPRKNIIDFFGKPMIAWTIESALKSNIFDMVFVSTDDQEIAEISKRYGAEVPFLRDKYADDNSPVSLVTLYALEQIEKNLGRQFETVVQLMPNCPLRESRHIIEAYENFLKSGASFQLSCFKFSWMNPWWAFKLGKDMKPKYIFPEALKKRSQDLEPLYCPTGAIWIAKVEALKKEKTFYGSDHIFFPIEWEYAIDIDTPEDLKIAKLIFKSHEED